MTLPPEQEFPGNDRRVAEAPRWGRGVGQGPVRAETYPQPGRLRSSCTILVAPEAFQAGVPVGTSVVGS